MSKTGKDYKLRELTDFDNIKNEDIKKLAILVCIHDSYLNGLIMEKDRVESKEYKKELKALIKESKKHSKKINKLFKQLNGKALEDRVIVTETEKIRENTVDNVDKDTLDTDSKPNKKKRTNTKDSTKFRDDMLEASKKSSSKNIKEAEDEVVLDTIDCGYEIQEEPAKLPVECELLGVKCIFTPQHRLIIKAENKLPCGIIDSKETLSVMTRSNLEKAIARQDLMKVKGEDNSYMYFVVGDITCSSKADAMKIITGSTDVAGNKFYVGLVPLDKYLITG